MNYEEILEYMYAQLPMYHRIGAAAYKPGLDNTLKLLGIVGNPHIGLKTVHVAGTNGKGSTSHLIASVLQEAGYKTGLYTSPHLKDFRERIRINGVMIPQEDITEFVLKFRNEWSDIQPSFFEITVALCFWFFKKEKTQVAVIETGLGGRLDSTNVIEPEISVITNIGYDHMNLLGDTIEKIAAEKAGIIKRNIPVVTGKMRTEALKVITDFAKQQQAEWIDSTVTFAEIPSSPLAGNYQEENKRTAFTTLKSLQNKFNISDEHIKNGFEKVFENTSLQGRWQVLEKSPLIIADVAHNEDGLKFVVAQIRATPHHKLHFVLGLVADKDVANILPLLPKDAEYYFCKANIPRGMDANQLEKLAGEFDLKGKRYSSVREAFDAARENAANNDLVFVGGSFFTVAEII